ncbi:hypothetical protein AB7X32_21825 [Morganella morganii]|uniref:hypothetical protein n=1 Tax=Morganella morganii TaxID=582 RepID=UPI0034E608C0
MTKIFKVPFATQGDRTAVPDEIQADGSLSYTQGYGYDYERDQITDPAAKDIEREKMNGLFHDITEAVGEIQAFGVPVWAEEGKPYAIRSIVYHDKKVWQSKIENNETEPAESDDWAELKADMTAGDVGAQAAGYSYSKTESDGRYQPKGNYAPAGNYAVKGESYLKTESDERYQPKGSYQDAGYSYSKTESDGRYQPKGNYAPAGNYAVKGESYLKTESDERYQPKGSYQAAGYSYSKAESDNKYQPKGNYALKSDLEAYQKKTLLVSGIKEIYNGAALNRGSTFTVNEDLRGRMLYLQNSMDRGFTPIVIPQDNMTISSVATSDSWYEVRLTNSGRTFNVMIRNGGVMVTRVFVSV